MLHLIAVGVVRIVVRSIAASSSVRREPRGSGVSICIESGARGFELIEIKELVRSAQESFGLEGVVTREVVDRRRYLEGLGRLLRAERPTHFWFDPRSGSQSGARALLQSIGVACLLARHGVTPIALLVDHPVRRWRLQVQLVTAGEGRVLTEVDPEQADAGFVHRRVLGPVIPAISVETATRLQEMRRAGEAAGEPTISIRFVGSLYEPRRSFLLELRERLAASGLDLEMHSRDLGGPRLSDERYWGLLASADIVVTTSSQVMGRGIDRTDRPHLIYRYTEALLAGAALVAPAVPGAEHLYRPERHFAAFEDLDDAVRVIEELAVDGERRRRLALEGSARAQGLIASGLVWRLATS